MVRKLHLKTTIIAIITGILIQSTVFAQTVIDDSFYSPSLDENRLVDIYLPPDYYSNPDLYYPVIYFLHGWGGNQNFLSAITSYAEQKINSGQIDPVIIVCASNYTSPFDGSMYMNSVVHGDFEDYMVNDLVSWLDSTYRTVPAKKYRSLMGHSMGGYGAFRYGSMHKDMFCGLAAHAAPANLELIIDEFENHIKSENAGPPYAYNYSSTGNFTKMIFLGAGVWSPNLNAPQDYVTPQVVEYPFDQQCNLIDTIFNKWYEHQVTSLVHNISSADSIGILFGCGSNDELYFDIPNNALQDTLEAINLDYEFYSHSGGHVLPTGFKNRALEFLDSLMLAPMLIIPCNEPDNLMADNITQSTVDLSWNENGDATSWEIVLGSVGFDPDNANPILVTNNPVSISNLTPDTDYEWYVRAVCGEGIFSDWAGPDTFATENDIYTQTIQLSAGWNIHSFNATPDESDMMDIHSDLVNQGILAKIIDEAGGFIQYITGYGWMNTIGDMQLTEGYYIKVDTAVELELTGVLNTGSYSIPLVAGWNIIGYPVNEGQSAMDVLQPLIDNELLIKVIDESGGFIQEIPGLGWLNTIGTFEPGEGYYIKVEQNTNLLIDYPQTSNMLAEAEPETEVFLFEQLHNGNPFNPMNIVVQEIALEGMRVMEGDEIGVFDGDLCVGAGVVKYENGVFTAVIVASMDDPETMEVDGFKEGNPIRFKYLSDELDNPIELVPEDISGSNVFKALGTYVVNLSYQLSGVAQNSDNKVDVSTYPNPVADRMTVSYKVPQGYVYIGIIDLNGTRIKNIANEFHEDGTHSRVIDVNDLNQGFYVLQIRVAGEREIYSEFHKFVKR